ncbi:MAG: hypothetical protein JW809_04065 [Pirellulales bacterium]|nr:hypothetical protein [Pirellulales bacterium]
MRILGLGFVAFCAIGCGVIQAAPPTPRELEAVRLQLQEMKASRDRLVSGVFRITGKDDRAVNAGAMKKTRAVNCFCAFDHSKDLFRWDRDTGEVVVAHQCEPVKQDFNLALMAIFIRRPEFTLHYFNGNSVDEVYQRSASATPCPEVAPFDVRCLGLAFNGTLDRYYPFARLFKACHDQRIVEVTETDGISRVVSSPSADSNVFFTTWFNQKQGCSPIRTELRMGAMSSPPIQRSETTWKETHGVWVPATFVGEDYDSAGKAPTREMEWTFQWESVNGLVPDRHFTAAGMGLPPETRIVSDESGKRVVLGTIGGAAPVPMAPR